MRTLKALLFITTGIAILFITALAYESKHPETKGVAWPIVVHEEYPATGDVIPTPPIPSSAISRDDFNNLQFNVARRDGIVAGLVSKVNDLQAASDKKAESIDLASLAQELILEQKDIEKMGFKVDQIQQDSIQHDNTEAFSTVKHEVSAQHQEISGLIRSVSDLKSSVDSLSGHVQDDGPHVQALMQCFKNYDCMPAAYHKDR